MAGIVKEIWINAVMDVMRQDPTFLDKAVDMSSFVENGVINLADAGVDPNVLLNSSYPVTVVAPTDAPIALPLDRYDTENTVVRNLEKIQYAYDKVQLYAKKHSAALRTFHASRASFNWAPSADTTNTPVLKTSGNVVNGYKEMVENDLIDLADRFDTFAPGKPRTLVLHHKHKNSLFKNSSILKQQQAFSSKDGFTVSLGNVMGFDIYLYNGTAVYNASTGVKKAWGAAAAGTDTFASFAFVDGEVMSANSDLDMFSRLNDPEARGDIFGYQQRGLALPMRNKYIGAIISSQ